MRIIAIPPKELRNDPETYMGIFENEVKTFNPDIIHFHYWDTANTFSQSEVCADRKLILTHHNQRNLLSHDWKKFDTLVVHTQKAKKILEQAGYWNVEVIQHGIDIEKFRFKDDYDPENRLLGEVGRIVPWKGIYEILKVAKDLQTKVIMMGRIDKPDYWAKCEEFKDQMEVRFNTPDEKQVDTYHEMGVYVGNSVDNVEEGTLGLLEAMACGIPVVTTPSGEAQDIIKDGENGILAKFEDYESLKAGVERFFSLSPEQKHEMRQKAWDTVRQMSEQVMARKYERLYYRLAYKKDLVSVIIPTYNRPDTITKVLDAYLQQTYQPIELVVVEDDPESRSFQTISDWRKRNKSIPFKYLNTKYEGYGLAMARNMGIFASSGHYIIFNDDRFVPEPYTTEAFINHLKQLKGKAAVWGDKGGGRRNFIENFFAIRKSHIVEAGMFNERVNEYGGQSQEVRDRLRKQGFVMDFEPMAKATPSFGTHNKTKKRYELFRTKTALWKLVN